MGKFYLCEYCKNLEQYGFRKSETLSVYDNCKAGRHDSVEVYGHVLVSNAKRDTYCKYFEAKDKQETLEFLEKKIKGYEDYNQQRLEEIRNTDIEALIKERNEKHKKVLKPLEKMKAMVWRQEEPHEEKYYKRYYRED
jgi:hypothetical protein